MNATVIIDTSIWVDHLYADDAYLSQLLDKSQVRMHPFVIGELACSHLANRKRTLETLSDLPPSGIADSEEVLYTIEKHKLMGRGIGYVDMHLIVSAILEGSTVWSRDKKLLKAASDLKIAHIAPPGAGLPS